MTMLSRYPLDKKTEKRVFEIFSKILAKIKTQEQAETFISEFFTLTEQKMLTKRISVAFLLLKGYQTRSICHLLKVSSATVNIVSSTLKYKSEIIKLLIDELIKDEKLEKFFRNLAYHLKINLPPRYRDWKVWRREIEKERHKSQKPFQIN